METTRTFVAVEARPPAQSVLARLLSDCRSEIANVRWVRPEQLHITVNFLGDIDNRELPKVCQALRDACRGTEPFVLSLCGLGTFPREPKPPRVLWAGVEEGRQQLIDIHEQLDAALSGMGIPGEGRAYSPHLTLGRVGRAAAREALAALVQETGPSLATQFDVDEVVLLASVRQRGKMVYETIDTVEL